VARNLYEAVPDDEARDIFKLPPFLEKMVAAKLLGDKTGGGFFKKVREEKDLRKPQPDAPETMGKDTAAAVNEGKATFTKSPEEHGDEHTTVPLGSLPPAPSEGGGGVGKGAEGRLRLGDWRL
jgi:3-hydroxyacyl-CoA dehydrogenase